MNTTAEYDAIVVGSGTGGATVARELVRAGRKVLILERGAHRPLREDLRSIVSMADEVGLGEGGLSTVRALTAGGSTSLYFGVVHYPELDVFRRLGIDLSPALTAVKGELPLAPLPDSLLTPQSARLRDSATALGHGWRKNDMLVDQRRCEGGYSYEAKWKAMSFVEEAVQAGATLVAQATVQRILFEGDAAVGVQYRVRRGPLRSETRRAYGRKVVLAAGELATPSLLRASGIPGVGDRGFYCNPGYAVYGLVPDLQGTSGYVGAMGSSDDDGIELGDANVARVLHRPMMLGGMKLRHLFGFPRCLGIGVKVKDGFGGELGADGRFRKTFGAEDRRRLDKGRSAAVAILRHAGARHIVDFGLTAAGRVGGLVRIGEHVDHRLQTRHRNLHVCDASVVPEEVRGPPTVTVVCLAKYLSGQLLAAL